MYRFEIERVQTWNELASDRYALNFLNYSGFESKRYSYVEMILHQIFPPKLPEK